MRARGYHGKKILEKQQKALNQNQDVVLELLIYFSSCTWVFELRAFMCTICVWYLSRSEEGTGFPATAVTDGCKRHRENRTSGLQDQQILLTAEPRL